MCDKERTFLNYLEDYANNFYDYTKSFLDWTKFKGYIENIYINDIYVFNNRRFLTGDINHFDDDYKTWNENIAHKLNSIFDQMDFSDAYGKEVNKYDSLIINNFLETIFERQEPNHNFNLIQIIDIKNIFKEELSKISIITKENQDFFISDMQMLIDICSKLWNPRYYIVKNIGKYYASMGLMIIVDVDNIALYLLGNDN